MNPATSPGISIGYAVGSVAGWLRDITVRAGIRLAPGNSGGPLADAQGDVIGIKSAIINSPGCAVTGDAVERLLKTAGLAEAA
jgi:serine protease Do